MNITPPPEVSQTARPALLTPAPTQFKRHRGWLWLLLVLCGAVAVWYFFLRKPSVSADNVDPAAAQIGKSGPGRRGGPGGGARPIAPVVAATARNGNVSVYLNGLGAAVPMNTVTVRSRVDGQLMRLLFAEGQVVKAGQVLAEIDPRAFEVQLTQAQGQMARDQALLVNARADLERYRTLFQQDSIAKQQLDTQQSLVRQYEGSIKADQGLVDNAKLQLSYARVTAPISGRIGLRQVDTGNIVHASDTTGLVVITQLQPITVLFTIPEDSIPTVMRKLQTGDKPPVDAYDRAQKNKLASGTLLTLDNQIDPATGTVRLKAQFANADYGLFPNQFVNTRMLVDVHHNVVIIPTAGIQRGTQGTFAYVINGDRSVSMRLIKVGQTEGEDSEITSGLKTGEVVVVDGADKLRDGGKVEVAQKDGVAVKGSDSAAGGRRLGAGGTVAGATGSDNTAAGADDRGRRHGAGAPDSTGADNAAKPVPAAPATQARPERAASPATPAAKGGGGA